jgi:hypothetical protein
MKTWCRSGYIKIAEFEIDGAQIGTVSFGTEYVSASKPNQVTICFATPGKCFERGKASLIMLLLSTFVIPPIRD